MKPNLKIEIAGIKMKNPVMTASGTFGYGQEYSQCFDLSRLGAVVVKGTTLKPKPGNPQPRIGETAAGLINSIGLQNVGVKSLIKDKLPFLRQFKIPVIVNIAGETEKEFGQLAKLLDRVETVAGLEVNISCPNVLKGKIPFGSSVAMTYKVVKIVKENTGLAAIVKLSPNVTDIKAIAQAAKEAGADAISLINTVRGAVFVKDTLLRGGLSGPAIKPIALWMVAEIAEANLGLPIIGMGGITDFQDAIDFLKVGATAVAIGTASFVNPQAAIQIIEGIENYLMQHQIPNIKDLRKTLTKRR